MFAIPCYIGKSEEFVQEVVWPVWIIIVIKGGGISTDSAAVEFPFLVNNTLHDWEHACSEVFLDVNLRCQESNVSVECNFPAEVTSLKSANGLLNTNGSDIEKLCGTVISKVHCLEEFKNENKFCLGEDVESPLLIECSLCVRVWSRATSISICVTKVGNELNAKQEVFRINSRWGAGIMCVPSLGRAEKNE